MRKKLAKTTEAEKPELGSIRDGFGKGLLAAAEKNPAVVGLCADLSDSVRMQWFKETYSDRYFEVGVAEQNLVGVAGGFALGGKLPFAASYAAFSPGNSWGVIRTTICYSKLNVKLVGGHAGLSVGEDGATHQAMEDIAIMRVLPHMTVVVPADEYQAYQATLALAEHTGPAYLRISRINSPKVTSELNHTGNFELGKAQVMHPGTDLTIIACGIMVAEALKAAQELRGKNISARVINLHTIKPIDREAILSAAEETRALLTVEEHQQAGGMGSAVAEVIAESLGKRPPLKILGMNDSFGESGDTQSLLAKYRLTSQDISREAELLYKNVRKKR